MKLTIGDKSYDVELTADGLTVDGETFTTAVEGFGSTRMVSVNGRTIRVDIASPGEPTTDVTVEGQTLEVSLTGSARTAARTAAAARASVRGGGGPAAAPAAAGAVKGAVTAQMTGRVVRVAVAAGTTVAAGDLLLILEAMKMENEIRSPRGGTIKEVLIAPGDRVNQGSPLVVIED